MRSHRAPSNRQRDESGARRLDVDPLAAAEEVWSIDTTRALSAARPARWPPPHAHRADPGAQVRLTPLARVCDGVVEGGTAALVAFAVVAFGGMLYWVPYIIVLGTAAVAAVWCMRVLAGPTAGPTSLGAAAVVWLGLLAAVLIFPLVPLPPSVLRLVAPHTYALYTQALPGWPERVPFTDVAAWVDLTGLPLGGWRPLALVPYDTVSTLWTGAAYATLGAVVACYPWRDRGRAALTRLTVVLIALGAFEAIYGMVQQSEAAPSIFGSPCTSPVCIGTYLNPDHYAGLLEMILPLAIASALRWFSKYRRHSVPAPDTDNWRPRAAHYLKAVYDPALGRAVSFACVALLLCVAMAVSGCRSALAATVLSILLMLPLLPSRQRRAGHLHITAVAVVVLGASVWFTFPRLTQKFATHDFENEVHLTGTRALIAADTLDMVRQFPVLGIGLGNFTAVFPAYRARTVRFSTEIEHAHNDYLEWLAEAGVCGAAVAFGLLLWIGARVYRALRRAEDATSEALLRWGYATGALALLCHSWTDFNLHVPANALVFGVFLGALLRLTSPAHSTTGLRVWSGVPLAAGVLIILAISSSWQRWSTAAVLQRTQADAARNPAGTLATLEAAAVTAPDAPRLLDALGRQRARAQGVPESPHAAARAFVRALANDPRNPRALLQLASAIDPLGQPAATGPSEARTRSVDLVTRAASLSPYEPELQLDLADWYLSRWALFDATTRTHAGAQMQAILAATARAPYVVQRRYNTLNAYDRVRQ